MTKHSEIFVSTLVSTDQDLLEIFGMAVGTSGYCLGWHPDFFGSDVTETNWNQRTRGHLVCDFCHRWITVAAPAEHHQLVWTWITADLSRALAWNLWSVVSTGCNRCVGRPPNGWFIYVYISLFHVDLENPWKSQSHICRTRGKPW